MPQLRLLIMRTRAEFEEIEAVLKAFLILVYEGGFNIVIKLIPLGL